MKILIINKSDLSIAMQYDDVAPNQSNWGGPWGDSNQAVHVACPEELDADCVKAIDQGGSIILQQDEVKTAQKLERSWSAMRAQRDAKLAECDWTQVADSPLSAQAKADWADYRQALRNLPANTVDPKNPNWPQKPGVQV